MLAKPSDFLKIIERNNIDRQSILAKLIEASISVVSLNLINNMNFKLYIDITDVDQINIIQAKPEAVEDNEDLIVINLLDVKKSLLN